jgi:hypothetical protein
VSLSGAETTPGTPATADIPKAARKDYEIHTF